METTKSDLVYSISNDDLCIEISMLLEKYDYDANWDGDNGADGFETENVSRIREILNQFSNSKYGVDLQIWEQGNAFAKSLKPEFLLEIKASLENAFIKTFDLVKRI